MIADKLKKSILQQAIQGKLLPQNSADEPASELLKKIFAERQKLIDEGKIKAAPPLPPISPEEIPFEIPENWQWVRLGDICQINPRNKVNNENITASFLPMTNIGAGYQNFYNPLIRNWKDIKNGFTHFADGDIIFAKITPCFQNIKSVYVQNLENGIGAGTTELFVIRSYGGYIFGKYLLYFVKNPNFINDGVKNFKGTAGQQRISSEFVKNYLIPLPPLAEQKRIVAKLEELMPLIERLDAAEKKLAALDKAFPDQLRKSILQQAIQGKLSKQLPTDGDARQLLRDIKLEKAKLIADGKIKKEKPLPPISPDEITFDIPKNWQWVRLGDIVQIKGGKRIPVGNKLTTIATAHKYIRVADMQNGTVLSDDIHYVPDNIFSSIKNYIINSSDVYITCAGTIGRVGTIPTEFDGANLTENADKLVFNNLNKYWLKFALMSEFLQQQITEYTTKVGQPKLAIKRIALLIIPLPPLAEQKRIVAKLEELLPLCDRLAEKLK